MQHRPGGNASNTKASANLNAFADLVGPLSSTASVSQQGKPLNSFTKATTSTTTIPYQHPVMSNGSRTPPPTAAIVSWPTQPQPNPIRSSSPATNYNGIALDSLDPFAARPASINPKPLQPPYSIASNTSHRFDGLGPTYSSSSNTSYTQLQSIPASSNSQQATSKPEDLLSFDNAGAPSSTAKPSMKSMMLPNQPSKNTSLSNQHLLQQASAWDQLDIWAAGKSAASNDIFDLEYLNNKNSGNQPVSIDDNILGVLSGNPLPPEIPQPVVHSNDAKLEQSMEKLASMGFDSEISTKALVDSNMNLDQAISNLLKPTLKLSSPKLEGATQDLVKMGFEYAASKTALQSSGLDKQAAIAILVSEAPNIHPTTAPGLRSQEDQDYEKVTLLMQAGFKEQACRAALKSGNGAVEAAIDLLLHSNYDSVKPSASRFDANSLVGAASQIGFSVFKNAKTAFSIAKKKVGEVLNEKGSSPGHGDMNVKEWSSSNFRDASDDGIDAVYSNIRGGSDNFKPFIPQSPMLSQDSDESVDIPLERRTKLQNPPVEKSFSLPTENLLQLDLDGSDSEFVKVDTQLDLPTMANPDSNCIPVKSQSNYVVATDAEMQKSISHRASGNDSFKKGQFGDAEVKYTLGIECMPVGHPDLIHLYNNRAACRLKNGDNGGAIADCDNVLQITPNDLKALQRRATAYEALENWERARDDFRKIMGIDSSVKGCSIGLARVNAAIQSKYSVLKVAARKNELPKPSITSVAVKKAVDEAVQKVRNINDAKEHLENQKFSASEKVEAMNNKEANIRALLSSLDTILWPECGWKPVTLGDLISPVQVKKKYIQAVSKVHPDKLGSSCTVEQQLIASSIFTVLNKSWDAFKLANNI